MKAIEFIKEFGWELAQRDIACLDTGFIKKEDFLEHYGFEILDEIRVYVDAYELVQLHGGLRLANHYSMKNHCLSDSHTTDDLWTAIALVEEVENCNEKTKEGDPS